MGRVGRVGEGYGRVGSGRAGQGREGDSMDVGCARWDGM